MGEILPFTRPQEQQPEEPKRAPEPRVDTSPAPPRAVPPSVPITRAQEQRLEQRAGESAHEISPEILGDLQRDANGWLDDVIPAVTHAHFEALGFLERWRKRRSIRAFEERLAQFREPVALSAVERLIAESQAAPALPPMHALKERLGQLCLEELEKRVPRDLLTAADLDALRALGVREDVLRRTAAERERQSRVVRSLRSSDDGARESGTPTTPNIA